MAGADAILRVLSLDPESLLLLAAAGAAIEPPEDGLTDEREYLLRDEAVNLLTEEE